MKQVIQTDKAPKAIGAYSQAVKVNETVYISGQIGLDSATGEFIAGDVSEQLIQVLKNLSTICEAAGGHLKDLVKLTVYLVDLNDFSTLNEIMEDHFEKPYPARAAVQVSALPKGASVEIDAVMVVV